MFPSDYTNLIYFERDCTFYLASTIYVRGGKSNNQLGSWNFNSGNYVK